MRGFENPATFSHFPELTTDRLRLRSISMADKTALEEIMAFRGSSTVGMPLPDILDKLEDDFRNGQGVTWGLDLNGEVIGTCGYYRGFNDGRGEIGFVQRAAFQRQGFMAEACRAVMAFGFDVLELSVIDAFTRPDNAGAIGLLVSLGFEEVESSLEGYVQYVVERNV